MGDRLTTTASRLPFARSCRALAASTSSRLLRHQRARRGRHGARDVGAALRLRGSAIALMVPVCIGGGWAGSGSSATSSRRCRLDLGTPPTTAMTIVGRRLAFFGSPGPRDLPAAPGDHAGAAWPGGGPLCHDPPRPAPGRACSPGSRRPAGAVPAPVPSGDLPDRPLLRPDDGRPAAPVLWRDASFFLGPLALAVPLSPRRRRPRCRGVQARGRLERGALRAGAAGCPVLLCHQLGRRSRARRRVGDPRGLASRRFWWLRGALFLIPNAVGVSAVDFDRTSTSRSCGSPSRSSRPG